MAEMSDTSELENLFLLATEFVRNLRDLKNESKLKFYGLFKQVSNLCSTSDTTVFSQFYNGKRARLSLMITNS